MLGLPWPQLPQLPSQEERLQGQLQGLPCQLQGLRQVLRLPWPQLPQLPSQEERLQVQLQGLLWEVQGLRHQGVLVGAQALLLLAGHQPAGRGEGGRGGHQGEDEQEGLRHQGEDGQEEEGGGRQASLVGFLEEGLVFCSLEMFLVIAFNI